MEQRQSERLYVISVGDSRDMTEGRSFYYYIEDKNGEKALPVFTARGGAQKYISNNLRGAKAHLDMLESVGAERAHILRKDVGTLGRST
jgi:hypothetical protein